MKNTALRLMYKIIIPIRKILWRLVKPIKLGVRAIVLDEKDDVLLVKHSYINGWYLPGGGVDKKENFIQAIQRELHEELGISVTDAPHILGVYTNTFESKTDYIGVFIISKFDIEPKENIEITEFKFFSMNNLPAEISPGSQKRLLEFQKLKEIDGNW